MLPQKKQQKEEAQRDAQRDAQIQQWEADAQWNEQAASFLTSLLVLFTSTAEVLHAKVLLAAEQCLPEQQRDEHQDASEAAAQQAQDV